MRNAGVFLSLFAWILFMLPASAPAGDDASDLHRELFKTASYEVPNLADKVIKRLGEKRGLKTLKKWVRDPTLPHFPYSGLVNYLERRTNAIEFARDTPMSPPNLRPESMEMIWFSAQREGERVFVSWDIYFGDAILDGKPTSEDSIEHVAQFEISVSGENVKDKIRKTVKAKRGNNRRNKELIASGLAPGKYHVALFMWSQYKSPTGEPKIRNSNAGMVTLRWNDE